MKKKFLAVCTIVLLCGCATTNSINTNDDTYNSAAEPKSVAEQTAKPLELVSSGWSSVDDKEYVHVYYGVEITNPNTSLACEFPTIIITSKDKDGKILDNSERILNYIAANDTIVYGGDALYQGTSPDNVEISVKSSKDAFVAQKDSIYIKSNIFDISNISEISTSLGTKYTGEIKNNSDVDIPSVSLSVIYKSNNKIVAGDSGYVDDIKAGETAYFDFYGANKIEYDTYEIHAVQW